MPVQVLRLAGVDALALSVGEKLGASGVQEVGEAGPDAHPIVCGHATLQHAHGVDGREWGACDGVA